MSFISELTSTVPEGNIESIYTELALYGRKMSVLGRIMYISPYLRSAMVWFPFGYFSHLCYSPLYQTPLTTRSIPSLLDVILEHLCWPLHTCPASSDKQWDLSFSQCFECSRKHFLHTIAGLFPSFQNLIQSNFPYPPFLNNTVFIPWSSVCVCWWKQKT